MTDGNKKLGYISIYRSIKDHWIWDDPVKFQWWISLLLEVNFKERKVNLGNELVLCKRGQTVKSLKHFAELWNTTRDSARNFLVLLEKDGMILRKNLHKSTQITICNYDSYQDNLHANQTQYQRQTKRKPNANQTHSDTNNNVNTVNNLNNENNIKTIVEYLNKSVNKNYKDSTDKTKTAINARINEGFTIDNFKKVIDVKTKQWLEDQEMNKYLRPETLFGSKFESYLNEQPLINKPKRSPEMQAVFDRAEQAKKDLPNYVGNS